MIVHGSYKPNSNGGVGPYDIALLKLATPATLSKTVKLAALPADNAIPTGERRADPFGQAGSSLPCRGYTLNGC